MNIPSDIDMLLDERASLALELLDIDYKISKFIIDNNIDADNQDYLFIGKEMYINPIHSAERIREAIRRKI